ncbi:MAG: hypothetical protein K5888_11320 [Lachnospiraceae bacterium]|nr:hypothetical protein [Lachnospiraceae bacterium]
MDKFEYKVKIGEIKSLIAQKAYDEAADVADTIDWTGVKNARDICQVSDLYKKLRLFEESRKLLLIAYKRQKTRLIVKSLCELSIELDDFFNAMEYFKEFCTMAPKDPGRFILQYKLYKAQNISIEEQIEILEQLKEQERLPKWEYELALLYHNAGMEEKCVEECEQIFLWIVDGKYAMLAYELKALHQPLTEQENYKYELLRHAGGKLNIQYSLKDDPNAVVPKEKELEVKGVDVSPYNTQNLQAVVAEGLQDYLGARTAAIPEEEINSREEAIAKDDEALSENIVPSQPEVNPELMVTTVYNAVLPEESVGQELVEEEATDEIPKAGRSDTDIIGKASSEVASEILNENVPVIKQDTDEIRPITGEIEIPVKEETPAPEVKPTPEVKPAPAVSPFDELPEGFEIPKTKYFKPDINSTGIIETFRKGSHMDEILSQEYDGQISIVLPEETPVEKQITGQISISDVMKDWERKKKENEEKRIAEVKAQVRREAGGLLNNFDEATKSGLLEQIESAMVSAALKEEQERIRASRPKQIKVADIDGLEENKKEETKVAAPKPATEEDRVIFAKQTAEAEFKPLAETVPHEEIPKEEIIPEEEPALPEEAELGEAVFEETDPVIVVPEATPVPEKAAVPKEIEPAAVSKEDESAAASIEEPVEEENVPEEEVIEETAETGDIPGEEPVKEEESIPQLVPKKQTPKPAPAPEKDALEEEIENAVAEAISEDTAPEKAPKAKDKGKDKPVKDHQGGSKPRALTDNEKEQFAAFIHHKSTRRQLANTLDNITLASYTGNVLVTSEEDNEITTFSKLLVREIQMSDANFTGKVAKVSGDNLNRKDIDDTLRCVSNGALIISEAEGLKKKTVETLLYELQHTDRGVVVIMQGHADIIDKIVQKNEGMAETFNLRIDLKAFDNKTLVEYAKSYAYDNEYLIDDLGVLALHTRISDMQTSDHEVTLSEIEEIVDEAIYYSNKKTPAHFFDVLFGKRYGDEDMIVLREKDFMHY